MSDVMINRRQAVRAAAGVAAGGLLVTGAGVGSAAANRGSGLLGAGWSPMRPTRASPGSPS